MTLEPCDLPADDLSATGVSPAGGSNEVDQVLAALPTALAPLGPVRELTLLDGGTFATTVRVDLSDGRRLVAKTAPARADYLLRHEHDLIRTEALVYRLAGDHPGLLMPAVVHTDFTRTVVPGDLVVATWLDGVRADAVPGLAEATAGVRNHRLGGLMAELHTLTGRRFGYPSGPEYLRGDTWAETFGAFVEAMLADAEQWRVDLPVTELRAALARHRAALDTVARPHLVHADLWTGNLFIDPDTGELTGVIDPERAFWGDPLFDLIAAEPFGAMDPAPEIVAGYRAAGGDLPVDTPHGRARLALCRVYLAIVMLVDIVPRQFTGDWLVEYTARTEAGLRAALDELA